MTDGTWRGSGRGIFLRRARPSGCSKCEATDFADCWISTKGNRLELKREEFERLPEAMPKWIKDHVELYLSDPEKAHLWDSSIGRGPGPLPTLLVIARGSKGGKLPPQPLLTRRWMVSTSSSARRAARRASGLVHESEGESGARDQSGCKAHARPRTHGERRRCVRPTTVTRSELIRGGSRWSLSSRSAPHASEDHRGRWWVPLTSILESSSV